MAKVLCVLYDDPVDGYPKTYARDDIPKIDHYPGGQTRPRRTPSTSSRASCSAASPANWACANSSRRPATPWSSPPTRTARTRCFENELPDAEIVISQPFWPAYMTKERFDKAKKLKLIITAGIGSDHTDLQAAMDKGVTVAEVTYCNSISVSEHIVMMILALVRNYIPSYGWVVRGGWNIADCVERSYDLEGMNVGTVAAGRIGLAALQPPEAVRRQAALLPTSTGCPRRSRRSSASPSTRTSSRWSRSATWSPSTRRCIPRPRPCSTTS